MNREVKGKNIGLLVNLDYIHNICCTQWVYLSLLYTYILQMTAIMATVK